jgi:hypothetical protein
VSREDLRLLKNVSGLYAVEVGSDASTDVTLNAMCRDFPLMMSWEFYNGCIL